MNLPFDNEEYLSRQKRLFDELPESSCLIIPTNDKKIRSNDVTYPFRPNSYMLYLCGWTGDEGVFIASNVTGKLESTLFVPPRDTKAEIWEGKRLGPEGARDWPVDNTESMENLGMKINKILSEAENIFQIRGISKKLDSVLADSREVSDPRNIIDRMRIIKSKKEILHIKEASKIGSEAHILAMKNAFPDIGEWEIQSTVEGHFMKSKSTWSFPSIVGGGDNATILHYKENSSKINNGDLVLVDAGCEVNGYASDITRTWPVNGKYSLPQREIYDIVLEAEIAGINACQAGSPWNSFHIAASRVLANGLVELGVLDCTPEEALGDELQPDGPLRNYFMHGTGHLLGLDVHDVGGGRKGDKKAGPTLKPGMVLTVEPGLYFGSWRSDINVPDRYSGIGIRIEDDVLITDNGPEVLTSMVPKSIEEIEELVGSGV